MSTDSRSALAAALEIQQRAATVGFDWPDASGSRAKIAEELAELDEAVHRPLASGPSADEHNPNAEVIEELGDLLFAAVNYARHLGVEPEAALAAANEKFCRRFRYVEEQLAVEGLSPTDVGLTRLDSLWNEAKSRE